MRFQDSTARLNFNEIWNDTICPKSAKVMESKKTPLGVILVIGALSEFHKASQKFLNLVKKHFEETPYTDEANARRYLNDAYKAIMKDYEVFERHFPQYQDLIKDYKVCLDFILDAGAHPCADDDNLNPHALSM